MKRIQVTRTTARIHGTTRVRVNKRRQPRRDLPELDLRTPSGRRTLPY